MGQPTGNMLVFVLYWAIGMVTSGTINEITYVIRIDQRWRGTCVCIVGDLNQKCLMNCELSGTAVLVD